jgi:putative tryptophan/tyrosine transport system substrate-binding protein
MQFDQLKRREFITLLGGAATWPLAARAQQAGRLPIIGFLGGDASNWTTWTAAFVKRLSELGWIEDRTIAIAYRWSEGRPERIAEIAAEFVRLNVDLIVTNDSGAPIVKQATSVIPVVFVLGYDPVGTGLVASLARPGGNITGLSNRSPDLAGKRLELLREALPEVRRLAIMANGANSSSLLELREVEAAARTIGIEAKPLEIRRAEDIAPAFAALQAQTDALYVITDALVFANRTRIVTFALTARLPIITNNRESVGVGALMSYGPNILDLFQRAGDLVDKILRGAKPADIPGLFFCVPSRIECIPLRRPCGSVVSNFKQR